jgi:para-nitrobenzyl esterase
MTAVRPLPSANELTWSRSRNVRIAVSQHPAATIGRRDFAGPAHHPCLAGSEAALRARLDDSSRTALEKHYAATAEPDRESGIDLLSDVMWWLPQVRLAETQMAAGGRVWFSRTDHAAGLPPYERLGPAHGSDTRCLWDGDRFQQRPELPQAPVMRPSDLAVAAVLQRAVLSLARTGAPADGRLPHWPAYDLRSRSTLIAQDPPRLEHDPRRERRLAWCGLPEV